MWRRQPERTRPPLGRQGVAEVVETANGDGRYSVTPAPPTREPLHDGGAARAAVARLPRRSASLAGGGLAQRRAGPRPSAGGEPRRARYAPAAADDVATRSPGAPSPARLTPEPERLPGRSIDRADPAGSTRCVENQPTAVAAHATRSHRGSTGVSLPARLTRETSAPAPAPRERRAVGAAGRRSGRSAARRQWRESTTSDPRIRARPIRPRLGAPPQIESPTRC